MIAPPTGVRIWLVAGVTDMRRGFDGLAALVAQQLNRDPFSGQVFAFRGRRGHLIKLLFWDGQGLVLYAKRLDRGHFVWPATGEGAVSLTPAQLSMLTEGIDWRAPARTWRPADIEIERETQRSELAAARAGLIEQRLEIEEPVAQLVFGLIVRQRVERLQHQHAEHQHRVIRRTAAATAVSAIERAFQIGPEQLEVDSQGPSPSESRSERKRQVFRTVQLRDRLRAGDVWVTGSRRYRSFEERLVSREALRAMEADGTLPVAVDPDFDRFIAARRDLLAARLAAVDGKARHGLLPEVTLERAVGNAGAPAHESAKKGHQFRLCSVNNFMQRNW